MAENSNINQAMTQDDINKAHRTRLQCWLQRTSYRSFHSAIAEQVIGQPALSDVTLAVYLYLEKMAKGKENSDNIIIAGSSGNGKSATYHALRRYFQRELSMVNVFRQDCTLLVENGYKGQNASTLLEPMLDWCSQYAICFLDELDKKIFPSIASGGDNMNAKVQQGLLCAIEGCIIKGEGSDGKPKQFSSTSMLFIGLGAFDAVRIDKINKKKHRLGFSSEAEEEITHQTEITRQDLIEAGGMYEFIGRFKQVINYKKLDENGIRRIIAKLAREESDDIGFPIEIGESTINYLISESNSPFGIRLLSSLIHERVLRQYRIIKESYRTPKVEKIVLSENGDRIIGTFFNEPRKLFSLDNIETDKLFYEQKNF